MEPAEYAQLRAYEDWYWWFAAQRLNLLAALRELNLPRGSRVLDAGCGSGATLKALTCELGLCGHGMDVSGHAASSWNGSCSSLRCRASVNSLPYAEHSFDAVYSVDVLGCSGVKRNAALGELSRVLRPGGSMVLLVPAYQWMLSAHDAAVHSVHRFTRSELADRVNRAGFEVVRVTHRFPFFFPVIAAVRLIRKVQLASHAATLSAAPLAAIAGNLPGRFPDQCTGSSMRPDWRPSGHAIRSDLRPIPKWLNRLLLTVAQFEHVVTRNLNVPFGSTILLTARKVGV
jgi:SAM-dependent methyltransferase